MTGVLVDGHVHFHDCFSIDRFLDSAAENFSSGAVELGITSPISGVLLFSESKGDYFFRSLRDGEIKSTHGGWVFSKTGEATSIRAEKNSGEKLLLVAGRQIATSDGPEVLALITDRDYSDGRGFLRTLEEVIEQDCVTVAPWGFGKWWFRRGRLLRQALGNQGDGILYVGDSAGRLRLLPPPSLFKEAAEKGVYVLAGSDPLPFASQCTKVGRFGSFVRASLSGERPAAILHEYLAGAQSSPSTYGTLETLGDFIQYQLLMQAKKRGLGT